MYEYILERLEEEPDAVLCRDDRKSFWLPKSRCRIVQQASALEFPKPKPDMIVIRIPDDLADKHGLD
jgi:hypothetical protein